MALVRSMLTAPEATASMSEFLNERVANLSRAMGGDDADLRAALIVSSILGLTIARHFLKLDALTSASDADIARVARPWVTTGVDPAGRQIHQPEPLSEAIDTKGTAPILTADRRPGPPSPGGTGWRRRAGQLVAAAGW